MKAYYNFCLKDFNERKETQQENYEFNRKRQGDNSYAIKQRNQQIMMKLKRSQKQVEEYIKNRNHETMLKQELRQLREDDTVKVKQRQKRQNENRKAKILNKEKADEEMVRTFKQREQKLIDTRYDNLVRTNIEKVSFIDSLEKWAGKGFSTSRSVRKKLNVTASPGLAKLAQDALSPGPVKKVESKL